MRNRGPNKDWIRGYLHRHEKSTSIIQAKLEHMSDAELDALATPDARRMYNMAREVASDCHLTLSYIRFEMFRDRVLWAKAKPKHKVEDMVVSWMKQRYALFGLVLDTPRGKFYTWPDEGVIREPVTAELNDILAEVATHVPEKATWWDDQGEGLWDTFYNSQYISSRKNLPLFHKAMPKYYLDNFPGLATEKRRVENSTLDAYMSDEPLDPSSSNEE